MVLPIPIFTAAIMVSTYHSLYYDNLVVDIFPRNILEWILVSYRLSPKLGIINEKLDWVIESRNKNLY